MAQQLRVLFAYVEDLSLVPSTHFCGSVLFVTPVPEEPIPSSGFCSHQARIWYIDMHVGKALILIKYNLKFFSKIQIQEVCPNPYLDFSY